LQRRAIVITPVVRKRRHTYADYLNTPDEQRFELVEGELIMTPSPSTYHQWISKNIGFELESYVRDHGVGRVFYAPYDVRLGDENVLQPDVLFISTERVGIIGEKNVQGPPDLVVEVLSEGSGYRDLVTKKRLYAEFGVREYWIVDPGEKTVEVFSLTNKSYTLASRFTEADTLESLLLPDLRIDLVSVFAYEL